jgi:hypothetical protein
MLRARDNLWNSEVPMDAATRAEYDNFTAIRDITQTDPALRYYLAIRIAGVLRKHPREIRPSREEW